MANTDFETTIYNDTHTVAFKNNTHRYLVDSLPKPGVTTIMNKVLAKPGLMLWPLNVAMEHLKTKLPTITVSDLEEAALLHARKRDEGAGAGTLVHEAVEEFLRNKPHVMLRSLHDQPEEVMLAALSFEQWFKKTKPKVIAVERVVYSEDLDYAGTFDCILQFNGKTYLCDLKTTNASREAPRGVYAEYFIQLGGYLWAYTEERYAEIQATGKSTLPAVDDLLIISCRKDGSLDVVAASDFGFTLDDCLRMWNNCFHLYADLTKLKHKIGGR